MSSTIQSYHTSMPNFLSAQHPNMAAHMDPEQAHQREAVEHDGRSSALGDMKFPELDAVKATKPVRYRECLKNHAASIGGYALDGCGEFMPSGEEGSLEALRCAACDCHRNFHRREVQGEEREYNRPRRLVGPLMPAPPPLATPPISLLSARPPSASQMIMALGGSRPDFEDKEGGGLLLQQNTSSQPQYDAGAMMRKRFRTKFTTEQKERMWEFAEMVGWRMPKDDEHVDVAQFCLDIGIKRHVLKVWMHNNKHTLGKKNQ